MPLARPRFRLSTLLWIMLAVACWFGGMTFERWRAERERLAPPLGRPVRGVMTADAF